MKPIENKDETMADKKPATNKDTVTIEDIPRGGSQIGGKIEMSEDVVATVAALAARQVSGIHALGRSRFISFGESLTRGVDVEVGSKEAALDLEVIIDYGTNIREVSAELRKRIADEVDKMAGRKVIEVNINVVGIHLPEQEKPEPTRRVQ
jgi:uncharacterized alkaline shock family protein YloU